MVDASFIGSHVVEHLNNHSVAVVTTTIGEGGFLEHYYEKLRAAELLDTVLFYVIPDRKTPEALFRHVNEMSARGLHVICPPLDEQITYLRHIQFWPEFVPIDSDNRRNVGFLMALEAGCECIISIDDDNYCIDAKEFVTEHSIVNLPSWKGPTIKSSTRWYNICEMLDCGTDTVIYPRGFPYNQRHKPVEYHTFSGEGRVGLNAGLWLQDPDLDAATWLTLPVQAMGMKSSSVLLASDTWSPVNTQNTGVHRDVIPAYYYVRMGYPIAGLFIDRYGDILSGYFCQACVRHLGDRVRVGLPLVKHRRNSHNYLRDLTYELAGMWIINDLAAWLQDVKLSGSTYSEAYCSLASQLDDVVERFSGFIWTDATKGYFHQVAYIMRQWIAVTSRLVGSS